MRNVFTIASLLFLLQGCRHEASQLLIPETDSIVLIWHKSYENQEAEDVMTGLNWALAQIGATNVCEDNFGKAKESIILEIHKLGLSSDGVENLSKLHKAIKQSQAYTNIEGIDVGRYIVLLIGASEHYYKLTGVPQYLGDILKNYTFYNTPGLVTNSSVAFNHRKLYFSGQNMLSQLFLAVEIDTANDAVLEFETIEIMNNGHLRFGIFGSDSLRKNSSDTRFSIAGKPAKCMWCHESKILPLYKVQADSTGFYSYEALRDSLIRFQSLLNEQQLSLSTGIDFENTNDHSLMEIIYISFMYPSAYRLSNEWDMPVETVEELLKNLPVYSHPEFPFLGEGYARKDVEPFAPFKALDVSTAVREKSIVEVNYID